MKRMICFSLVLLLSIVLACPALAAEDTFVPSISYKGAPEIVVGDDGVIGVIRDENGEVVGHIYEDCLLLTPVSEAANDDQIPDEARQTLLFVYGELSNGNMQLPTEKLDANLEPDEVVIRDLFDATWLCEDHPDEIEPNGVVFEITFRLNVEADETVYTMTYKNNEWNPVVSTVNNGDGTVTCTFEHLCPVAFAMGEDLDSSDTGVEMDGMLLLWFGLLVVSAAGLVAVVSYRRKFAQ